jgi:hypothetical protein
VAAIIVIHIATTQELRIIGQCAVQTCGILLLHPLLPEYMRPACKEELDWTKGFIRVWILYMTLWSWIGEYDIIWKVVHHSSWNG